MKGLGIKVWLLRFLRLLTLGFLWLVRPFGCRALSISAYAPWSSSLLSSRSSALERQKKIFRSFYSTLQATGAHKEITTALKVGFGASAV